MIDYSKEYDNITIQEMLDVHKQFNEHVILSNGHVIGFEKDEDNE